MGKTLIFPGWTPSIIASSSFCLCLAGAPEASAKELHVSPDGSGDGSSKAASAAVGTALDDAEAGDQIILHEGYYGDLQLTGDFDEATYVIAAEDEPVEARTLVIQGATNLHVSGLSISLSHAASYATDTMVHIASSSFVSVSDCDIFSAPDSTSATWSAMDWANLPGTGINVRSPDITLEGNRLRNVGYGISINYDAPRAIVRRNHIQNFSRDGLRGVADDGLFEYNTVLDAYDVDDHHDDFFQSWSYEDGVVGTTVVRGVVLRGNTFINFTDPDREFAGAAQGIGCFDGFFEDWVVENNLVIVNHWHGITFLGGRNLRIVNNTVVDNRPGEDPGPPWIDVSAHKDGRESEGILIRNNVLQDLTLDASDSSEDHNLIFEDFAGLFVDAAALDFHLLDGAAAIDAGSADQAPALDIEGIPRPQGDAFDSGAFEWHDGSVKPSIPPLGMGGAGSGSDGAAGAGAPSTGTGATSTASGGRDNSGDGGNAEGSTEESGGCGCRQARGQKSGWFFLWSVMLLMTWALRGRRRQSDLP
jgi:hypothetical protein